MRIFFFFWFSERSKAAHCRAVMLWTNRKSTLSLFFFGSFHGDLVLILIFIFFANLFTFSTVVEWFTLKECMPTKLESDD